MEEPLITQMKHFIMYVNDTTNIYLKEPTRSEESEIKKLTKRDRRQVEMLSSRGRGWRLFKADYQNRI